MFKRVFTIIVATIVTLLLITGCGGDSYQTDEEAANEAWDTLTSEDQAALCDAYDLFGPQFVEDTFTELAESDNSELTPHQAGVAADKVIHECSGR